MTASSQPTVFGRNQALIVIDEDHLGRMTLGDRTLEREILEIFVRQIAIILNRITDREPAMVAAAAHTLLGSARGIGARRVASAAERLEQVAGRDYARPELETAIEELRAATVEASAAICARLANALNEASRDN